MINNFMEVPTWDKGEWYITTFETLEKFREFLLPLFKEPGKYNFDETSFEFNSQARKYNLKNYFCPFPEGSRDFRDYWDDQKTKCRQGVIFKTEKETVPVVHLEV